MITVVDVGCADYENGAVSSTDLLKQRFKPDKIYGFDPLVNAAAWIWDGEVGFVEDGVASSLCIDGQPLLTPHMQLNPKPERMVPCFDLAKWIRLHTLDQEVILKLDAEGAEYMLLTWLLATGAIKYVEFLLVEWHAETRDRERWRAKLEQELKHHCLVEDWSH